MSRTFKDIVFEPTRWLRTQRIYDKGGNKHRLEYHSHGNRNSIYRFIINFLRRHTGEHVDELREELIKILSSKKIDKVTAIDAVNAELKNDSLRWYGFQIDEKGIFRRKLTRRPRYKSVYPFVIKPESLYDKERTIKNLCSILIFKNLNNEENRNKYKAILYLSKEIVGDYYFWVDFYRNYKDTSNRPAEILVIAKRKLDDTIKQLKEEIENG